MFGQQVVGFQTHRFKRFEQKLETFVCFVNFDFCVFSFPLPLTASCSRLVLLKSSRSCFVWGSADVLSLCHFWPITISLADVFTASPHFISACEPSVFRSLSLALLSSSSVCFSGLSWTKNVRSEYSDHSGSGLDLSSDVRFCPTVR